MAFALVASAENVFITAGRLDETNRVFFLDVKKSNLPRHWILESAVCTKTNFDYDEACALDWQRVNLYMTHKEGGMVTLSVPVDGCVPGRMYRIRKLAK